VKAKTLGDEFQAAEAALLEAQRRYEKVRADYFLQRREVARAGGDLPPLLCADAEAWQAQLHREQVARSNGVEDRRAGLVPTE
jgi:hypothetical protein